MTITTTTTTLTITHLPVLASASLLIACSSAPARGKIVAERAPRGPDGRLNREYLPDDDNDNDGHGDDHDDDEEDDYIIEMKKGLLSMMSMNVYISNTLTSQHSLLKRRISYCSNTCKRY